MVFAVVYAGDTNVNAELLKRGYAEVMYQNFVKKFIKSPFYLKHFYLIEIDINKLDDLKKNIIIMMGGYF